MEGEPDLVSPISSRSARGASLDSSENPLDSPVTSDSSVLDLLAPNLSVESVDRLPNLMGNPSDSSDLTVQKLRNLYESLRQVAYCHPDNEEHSVIQRARECGWEVEVRDKMPKDRVLLQTPFKIAVLDLSKGIAHISGNPFGLGRQEEL